MRQIEKYLNKQFVIKDDNEKIDYTVEPHSDKKLVYITWKENGVNRSLSFTAKLTVSLFKNGDWILKPATTTN